MPIGYRPFNYNLEQRQQEMQIRMLRHAKLAELAYGNLERALTPAPDDPRDLQVRIASSVAIPTLKGIGEFVQDASPALLLAQPPAEVLARWVNSTPSSQEPIMLPSSSESDET